MTAEWMRCGRVAFLLSLGFGVTATPLDLWAQDDEDEEEEEEEEGGEEDEEQPPVTAGGLYTKKTYPQAEIERPLTITKGMLEMRAGLDIDMSAANAFGTFGLGFDVRYGVEDNVEIQGGLRSDLNNFSKFAAYGAIEWSIVYDLVDFRTGFRIPVTKTTTPGGESSTSTKFDLEIGFPFRYAPAEMGAVTALETFMTFNTAAEGCSGSGDSEVCANKATPDLTPSVGIVVQPAPVVAIKLNAKLIIIDFNTDAGNFQIPVSANVQFSPTNLIDIGGEFTFPNLKPPETQDKNGDGEPDAFYEDRFLLLYGQLRI